MLILILIVLLFSTKPNLISASEFSINKQVEFIITNDRKLTVNEKINLTNNYSQIYPTQYSYTITASKPQNITAHDQLGNILVKAVPENNSTIIWLKFNKPNIGKNQTTQFDLSYQLADQLVQRGENYELFLPSSSSTSDLTQASIIVPSWIGPLINNSSTPVRLNATTQSYSLNSSLFLEPQRLLFGHQQLFDFNLTYQLTNNLGVPKIEKVPIPPQTDRQKVGFTAINPKPLNVDIDLDGNYLAQYQLPPNSQVDVKVSGQIKLLPINTQSGQPQNAHFQAQTVWPTKENNIQTIAATLSSPKSIYDYVINTLNYNYDFSTSIGRVGAQGALANPNKALCTEFTDLFVTLARAKNIAAREIEGFVYTTNTRLRPANPNTDFLHAWPQYYNQSLQKWVEIDPTWAKTTNGIDYFQSLDLNHIIFVIHGNDSQNPPPPGFYKRSNDLSTVKVNLAQKELILQDNNPQLSLSQSKKGTALTIFNPGLTTLTDILITQGSWQQTIKTLPPYGHQNISYKLPFFPESLLPRNRYLKFSVNTNNKVSNQIIKNPRHFTHLTITLTISIIVLLGGAIIIAKRYD